MSWATKRTTTRIEDAAYCLLGIFDVNMPLLYGEEEKAFQRLQEEIIKSTPDLSIFASRLQFPAGAKSVPGRVYSGVLAPSPEAFLNCNLFVRKSYFEPRDFSVSNNGVKTRIQILSEQILGSKGHRNVLPVDSGQDEEGCREIRIRKCGPATFVREDPYSMTEFTEHLELDGPTERYLLTNLLTSPFVTMVPDLELKPIYSQFPVSYGNRFIAQMRSHALQFVLPNEMDIYDIWPSSRFDDEDQLFFDTGSSNRIDIGSMKLLVQFTFQSGPHKSNIELECGFYALGWSNPDVNCLQCTLVDSLSIGTKLNDLNSQSARWGFDRRQVLNELEDRRIPRQSSTAIEVQGTTRSIVLSLIPRLISDLTICRNKFWKIEFHYKVYETKNLQQIIQETWNV